MEKIIHRWTDDVTIMTSSSKFCVYIFKIKFPTKRIFRIFPILRINGMAPFCNLFIERPSYHLFVNWQLTHVNDLQQHFHLNAIVVFSSVVVFSSMMYMLALEKCLVAKVTLKGHPRSLQIALFDRAHRCRLVPSSRRVDAEHSMMPSVLVLRDADCRVDL